MKEQIYTIPVNEVYDTDCECPLCELEKKLEKETLDYALGAAMMEPEFRMEQTKKAFATITVQCFSVCQTNLHCRLCLTHI